MPIDIREINADALDLYAAVSCAFRVEATLQIGEDGQWVEQPVREPWVKDYDALDGGPTGWPAQWDLSKWGLWLAFDGAQPVGGAAVARGCRGINPLGDRSGDAVLGDIRVAPAMRGRGVGRALLERAAAWCRAKAGDGCGQLIIETQHINVPACRFYRATGCELIDVRPNYYASDPRVADEVMLLWRLGVR